MMKTVDVPWVEYLLLRVSIPSTGSLDTPPHANRVVFPSSHTWCRSFGREISCEKWFIQVPDKLIKFGPLTFYNRLK